MKYRWGKLEDYDNPQEEDEPVENSDYSFIQEKIKDRPINRRRLVKRMLITAGMALIFGIVACLSFLVIEPFLADFVSGKNENEIVLEQIKLPDTEDYETEPVNVEVVDTQFEETPLEDMNYEDMEEAASENVAYETVTLIDKQYDYEVTLEDFQLIYRKMGELSKIVSKSLVTITSMKEDEEDILDLNYESVNKTTGLIVADNNSEIYIFADCSNISNENKIQITFVNGSVCDGYLKNKDEVTKLGVISINMSDLNDYTKQCYTVCTFGGSYITSLLGSPVMAVGDPLAMNGSLCYGTVTSMNTYISGVDTRYQILTTDIYGSKNGYGFLFNTRGQVIGLLTPEYHTADMSSLMYAYGISSIKSLMEDMINDRQAPVVGVYVSDVEKDVKMAKNIPDGIFVKDVLSESPAMNAGVVPGDIIKKINDTDIFLVNDYLQIMKNLKVDDEIKMVVLRSNGEEYIEVELEIIAASKN